MAEPHRPPQGEKKSPFPDQVQDREQRKLSARRHGPEEVWFGLGMFGLVGWAVAVPTLIGIFTGVWLDLTFTSRYSWTLMLLVIGLALGCANAWYWIQRERDRITRWREHNHEH